jgi:hypothetical protein
MRKVLIVVGLALAACGGGGGGTGDDTDAAISAACSLPTTEGDAGSLAALAAQRCNVPGSQGSGHWWRLLGTLPSGGMDIVQLELWPNLGAFAGDVVKTGTFTITGDDANFTKCGVCVRAVGHHGAADQTLYFATAGTVEVTSFGDAPTPLTATITNATFVQVDAAGATVPAGCASAVDHVAVSGAVVNMGGTGGGGGGGGGGGAGGCKRTVGDI